MARALCAGQGSFPAPDCLAFPCREWYGYHFPELIKIVSDNYTYCRLAKFIGNRKELNEESLEGLEELVMDSAKAQAILDGSRSSMGQWRGAEEGPQGSCTCVWGWWDMCQLNASAR